MIDRRTFLRSLAGAAVALPIAHPAVAYAWWEGRLIPKHDRDREIDALIEQVFIQGFAPAY